MKLRNKKTGEIIDLSVGFIKDTYNGEFIQIKPVAISNKEGYLYDSLAELNEEWEDYEPQEPLIKDERARAIFKMWASNFKNMMIGNTFTFYVDKEYQSFMANLKPTSRYGFPEVAELDLNFDYGGLEDGKNYTFTELCGEEEE